MLGQDRGHREDQGVLALARHQPGHADDDGPFGEPEPGPDRVAARVRVERLLVDPGRQLDHAAGGGRGERGGDPGAGVLAEVGQRVGALADPPEQLPGRGQLGPARLVAVRGGDEAPGARPAQRRAHQAERGRGAEPDGRAAVGAQQLHRSPGHARGRQQHRRTVADDGEGLLGVEGGGGGRALGPALPVGGVDDDPVGIEPQRHVVQERLDASRTRREVVGHDQGLVHRRRQYRARAAVPDGPRTGRAGIMAVSYGAHDG